jgi:uncharacterized linocin/CFP29 family protein
MRIRPKHTIKTERYSVPKEYAADIVPGLTCVRKKGRDGCYYLVFKDEHDRIKWWIVPNAYTEFVLLHRNRFGRGQQHSQGVKGKASDLIDYIKKHEEFEHS